MKEAKENKKEKNRGGGGGGGAQIGGGGGTDGGKHQKKTHHDIDRQESFPHFRKLIRVLQFFSFDATLEDERVLASKEEQKLLEH